MKKKLLKGLGVVVLVLFVAGGGCVAYVETTWEGDHSDVAYPDVTASTDPAVIARGRYLVYGPAHCAACHTVDSVADAEQLTNEPPPPLDGGYLIDTPFGPFRAANLTSDEATGIGSRTDGEIARTIRHGVLHDGRLSAFMALAVGPMADEDLTAIVSYLRSVEPVSNDVLPSDPNFAGHAFISLMGVGPNLQPAPTYVAAGEQPSVARGEYLATGPAFCAGCHSQADLGDGVIITGVPFSGGPEPEPDTVEDGMEIVAPNLTPHESAHLHGWDEDLFVERLGSGERRIAGSKMPWELYARMTESDARSVWRYLQTLEPSDRQVGPTHREAGSWSPD